MKFLHTSDWHLGASEGTKSLVDDQRCFIDSICHVIEERGIDAVLIAGDVFDHSVASSEAIALYDEAMTRICLELHTPALVIAGNHDNPERLSSCGKLLEQAQLYVAGTYRRDRLPIQFNDTEIFLIPWLTEARVKSEFPEKSSQIKTLSDAYRVVTDDIQARFTPGVRHFALTHAFLANSETSESDRAAELGFAVQVNASVFDCFDYVALGHIHKPQNVNSHVRYSGTPMPYSYGKEERQIKSVTIVDTETMQIETEPLHMLHKRSTLKGTFDELINSHYSPEVQQGYVRAQVTDQYIGLNTLSMLREKFPNLTEASGKTYEGESTSIRMTVEALKELESDPIEVFRHFSNEIIGLQPDDHLISLFREAVEETERVD